MSMQQNCTESNVRHLCPRTCNVDNCCSGTPVARDLLVDTEGCGGALNGIYAYQGDTADGRSRFAGPCKIPLATTP